MSSKLNTNRVNSFQLKIVFKDGSIDCYNFDIGTEKDEAYTQYAALTQVADKSGKAQSITLLDLTTMKIVEETKYGN